MDYREFHIWDFPEDKISVTLRDEFRLAFFKALKIEVGSILKLSKFFKYNPGSFSEWKLGNRYILLSMLLEMSDFLVKKDYNNFNKYEIEKNIISLKSIGMFNRNTIINPSLPLREDEYLIKILGHLLADGYEGEIINNCNKRGSYCNSNKQLIEDFIKSLKTFGEVPIKINERKDKNSIIVFFPSVISYIIKKVYNINTLKTKFSRVPKSVFQLNSSLKKAFLSAIIDDEFTIYDSYIKVVMANKSLVLDLKKLFYDLGFKNAVFYETKRGYFYLQISDIKKIANTFTLQKLENIEKLKYAVFRTKTKRKHGEIKNNILNLLSIKHFSIKELSQRLGVHYGTMRRHFAQLKTKNLISVINVKSNTRYWGLMEV